MIAGIPEAIHDFNVYNAGNKLIGLTGEVTLPELEAMTETISGAGMLGEMEAPMPGHFSSIEQEIPFRTISEEMFALADTTRPVELTLRGAIQYNVLATGATDYVGMRIVFRGKCKKFNPGTVKQAGAMNASITLEVSYFLLEMDGKKRIELNKVSHVFNVNGVDVLEKLRKLT